MYPVMRSKYADCGVILGDRMIRSIWVLAVVLLGWATFSAPVYAQDWEAPFVRIFDTKSHQDEPLKGADIQKCAGWELVPEDETNRVFQGGTVLANGRLAVAFREQGPGGEVYAFNGGMPIKRAVLSPSGGRIGWLIESVQVTENTTALGSVEVTLVEKQTTSQHAPMECVMSFTLQMGQVFVQTKPVRNTVGLGIAAEAEYAVIPDFFADDIVLGAGDLASQKVELPGDNFLLQMAGQGDSILLSVSKNRESDISMNLRGEGKRRHFEHASIYYGEDGAIWFAVLEGKSIWNEYMVRGSDAGKTIDLQWKAPFAAQWRVDWRQDNGLTDSWEMLLQRKDGAYEKHGWLGTPEAVGTDDWLKSGGKRWTTVLGWFHYPCWIDNRMNGYLQPLKKVVTFEGPVLIYPINRVQNTPLDRYTVVDIVRATLGVGPCEYVLDLEGQQMQFKGMATCAAREVINPIFKEGRQKECREEIEKALANALAFVKHIRGRIEEYRAFGREMTVYLDKERAKHPELAEFLDEMKSLTADIEGYVEKRNEKIKSPAYVEELMQEFRENLLDYEGPDALERCKQFTHELTTIGGHQDELVGECRVAVRRLRQRAGLTSADMPEAADIANEIREKTQAILRNPASYEAPRH